MKRLILILTLMLGMFNCLMAEELNIVPRPASVEYADGRFNLRGMKVYIDGTCPAEEAVSEFIGQLSDASGEKIRMVRRQKKADMLFVVDQALADEGYLIDVQSDKMVVKASSAAGFLYSLSTLKQMVPVAFFGTAVASEEDWTLPCVRISDKPRFAYRGVHLDCARHFFTIEQIRKYIDILALYKVNRFHWHLTDDHAWRLEIKKYPLLTEIGARNCGAILEPDPKAPGEILYEGFYTQEEARGIVEYAAAKGITVIPEIDMPSHMTAALAAYPELGCTRGPYEVITVVGPRGKGLAKDNLCAGREGTFSFINDVLDEVMDIFPSEYIHVGGDECIKDRWYECPDCQKRMADEGIVTDEKYSNGQYLQVYFINRVQKYLNSKGRRMIGWDEILDGNLDEGATVMSWRGPETGHNAARRGFDVIMAPVTHCYFDYRQSRDMEHEPRAFAGTVSIDKVYSFNPVETLTPEEAEHIVGVQANLWGDVIGVWDLVEYMLLPRLAAISEVQWCSPENMDYERFNKDMDHHRKIYDMTGYVYAKHIWGIIGLPGHEHEMKTN